MSLDEEIIGRTWGSKALRKALAEQPMKPATEADMAVYKAIADNYHASPPQRRPLTVSRFRGIKENT